MALNDDIELDEVLPQLIKAGFPTFDEFKKNPDLYRKGREELLESADKSSQVFRDAVHKQNYMWRDAYTCRTLEELERVCKSEGFEVNDCQMRPIVKSTSKGRVNITVQFWPANEFEARGGKLVYDK